MSTPANEQRMKQGSVVLTCRMTIQEVAQLDHLSQQAGVSRKAAMEQAVREWVERQEPKT